MKKIKYILSVAAFVTLVLSCKNDTKTPSGEEKHAHGEAGGGNTVSLTEAQLKAINLEFGKIEMKQLAQSVKANGYLKVPNQNKAKITTLYSGQVQAIYVQPGDYVSRGKLIATLHNPEQIQLQEQYLNVINQIRITDIEVKRQKELYEGNAGALKNLQYAQSQLRSLQTQRASLSKQLKVMGLNPASVSENSMNSSLGVRAPISGVISDIFAEIGSYVDASSIIAEMVDNNQLHLDLDVYEKDLPLIRKDQKIHFTLTNNPTKEYDAEIYSIGSAFEDESKTIPVHAKVMGDKNGLIEGMNVVAVISLGKELVPSVPETAIVNSGAEDFIFIRKKENRTEKEKKPHQHEEGETHSHNEEGHSHGGEGSQTEEFVFEKIPVAKGTTDVGYCEITPLREIPSDAEIVVKGAFFLLAKMNNKGEAHAH